MSNNSKIILWKPLLAVIKDAEASLKPDKTRDYNSVVGVNPIAGLSNKIIAEAVNSVPKDKTYIGAYQFHKGQLIPGFIKTSKGPVPSSEWAKQAGLDPYKDKFNETNQDLIAIYLIEKRGGNSWKNGPLTTEQFMINLSQEWAGLPVPENLTNIYGKKITTGNSYYTGIQNNKANVTVNQVKSALKIIYPTKVNELIEDEIKLAPSPPTSVINPNKPTPVTIIESEYLQYIQN
jgi:hypothetical protein